jgi:HlyD family secretion protein
MANNKKSKKKLFIFSGIGLVLVVLVVLVVLGSKKEPVISVQTERVARRTITQTVTATGKIYPEVQVIITPEVSGEIIELPVKEGQPVRKGEVLLKIKPDYYVAIRDQSAAGLASAQASLSKSEADFRRINELFGKGLVSQSELDQAQAQFQIAKAQHEQAEANLKQANENLRKTVIYSPMEGTVSQLKVEIGERVLGTSQFQGTTVMTIADLLRMEARVDVGENDVVLISVGDTSRIDVDAFGGRKFTGVVYEIANTAKTKGLGTQEEVTNFEVKIRILDKDVSLRPGMSMTATIETETKDDVLSVPIQSVTARAPKDEKSMQGAEGEASIPAQRGKQKKEVPKEVVFVVDDGVAKMVQVKRGIANDQYVEVIEGIEEGKEVVSGSYKAISRDLEDGSKIRVEKEKQAQKQS